MRLANRRSNAWLATLLVPVVLGMVGVGCTPSPQTEGEEAAGEAQGPAAEAEGEAGESADEVWPPEHIVVQHVLISFSGAKGKIPNKSITRTREEAEKLARDLLERARAGEDFGALVKEHTDDQYPGFYFLANEGVEVTGSGEYSRGDMVKGFGDVAFSLRVGEVGLAEYDEQDSPYGWHVIKRVQAQ